MGTQYDAIEPVVMGESLGIFHHHAGRLFQRFNSLAELFQEAARLGVELLDVQHCAVVCQVEDGSGIEVRASFHHNGKNGIYLKATSKNTVDAISGASADASSMFKRPTKDKLAAPVRVNGEVVGFLCVSKRRRSPDQRFVSVDRDLFFALSEFLGYAIEMQQMRQLLASRYAPAVLYRDQHEKTGQEVYISNVVQAVRYPNKVAKMIAKSFYKDLRKAGFEPKQILLVASEIIDNLNEAFRRTKEKTGDRTDVA